MVFYTYTIQEMDTSSEAWYSDPTVNWEVVIKKFKDSEKKIPDDRREHIAELRVARFRNVDDAATFVSDKTSGDAANYFRRIEESLADHEELTQLIKDIKGADDI